MKWAGNGGLEQQCFMYEHVASSVKIVEITAQTGIRPIFFAKACGATRRTIYFTKKHIHSLHLLGAGPLALQQSAMRYMYQLATPHRTPSAERSQLGDGLPNR